MLLTISWPGDLESEEPHLTFYGLLASDLPTPVGLVLQWFYGSTFGFVGEYIGS